MAPRGGKHRGGRGQPQTSPRRGDGGSPYHRGRGRGNIPGSSFAEEELALTARMMSQVNVNGSSLVCVRCVGRVLIEGLDRTAI
jgi:hypothetical protein